MLFAKALCTIISHERAFWVVCDLRAPDARLLAAARPDLIIIDVDGQPGDIGAGLETCAQAVPGVRICVLSMQLAPAVMERCFSSGAAAYVVKDIAPPELLSAMRAVAAGESYVDPRVSAGALLRLIPGQKSGDSELSAREAHILRLIADGLPNKQISARLRCSEKTVQRQVGRIFAKLKVSARTQAAVLAVRAGLA